MLPTLDFWTNLAQRHGQAIALEDEDTQVSYAELLVAVNALAVALQAKDPVPGSRVALCAEQSLEYMVGMLAIMAAGKIPVPLSCRSSTETLHQIINDALCSAAIVDQTGHEKIRADDEFTILVSQFEGLVRTYRDQVPERCGAQPEDEADAGAQEA